MKSILLALALIAALASVSRAQTFTLTATSSAFLSGSNPTNNYGGAGALEVSATNSAKGNFDSVMEFNLASVAGLTIQSISIQLVTASPNNAIFNANAVGQFSVIWMQDATWVEGTGTPMSPTTNGITYNTLPNYLTPGSDENIGTFTSSAVTSTTNTYSLTLASGFLNALTSGSTVSLEVVPDDSNVSYLFNSATFTTASARPMLTVVAVPEPARLVHVGVGLLALVACRKRWPRRA